MELRRASTALLRSHGSPVTNLLTASACTAGWTFGSQLSNREPCYGSAKRTFNSTSQKRARNPAFNPPTTTAAPSPPPPSPSTPASASSTPKANKTPASDLSSLATSLGWIKPSRFTPRPKTSEEVMNGGSTADSILASINAQRAKSGAEFAIQQRENMDLSRMQDPTLYNALGGANTNTNTNASGSTLSTMMRDLDRDLSPRPGSGSEKERVPFVLKPLTGRMVDVNRTVDVGRAFKLLEQSCARNKVRADATRQRFYERGGLKRKRLRRERWRRRFMEGFRATVGRVKELKGQGW